MIDEIITVVKQIPQFFSAKTEVLVTQTDAAPPLQRAGAGDALPPLVQACPVTMKYLALLAPLDWDHFPERPRNRAWPGVKPHPRAPYVAAYLVKLYQKLTWMTDLRTYLVEHPALVWLLGFKLQPDFSTPHGFDVEASVPSAKQLGRVLRELDNQMLQFLLDCTVSLIAELLPAEANFGQAISLDTKHIIAWVKENNPKAYIKEGHRLDKTRQPQGDKDCKLGCKKKSNQNRAAGKDNSARRRPITNFSCDQYFWGYNSGVVATKVSGYGEFVLAEYTQTFDRGDTTFFFPLMAMTQARLGFAPPYGALDAGFDAWYVHDYFHDAGGFAAVPKANRGPVDRQFDPDGLPLCQAGLAMPCKSTFRNRRGLIPQEMGRYVCPLLYPQKVADACPVEHQKWPKGGCLIKMGTSPGARLRYQLDRKSEAYLDLYRQRTADERVNAQAKAFGIERPRLRTRGAISNQNTLIYILINLKAVHRLLEKQESLS